MKIFIELKPADHRINALYCGQPDYLKPDTALSENRIFSRGKFQK
jgi:hypothetical protein